MRRSSARNVGLRTLRHCGGGGERRRL